MATNGGVSLHCILIRFFCCITHFYKIITMLGIISLFFNTEYKFHIIFPILIWRGRYPQQPTTTKPTDVPRPPHFSHYYSSSSLHHTPIAPCLTLLCSARHRRFTASHCRTQFATVRSAGHRVIMIAIRWHNIVRRHNQCYSNDNVVI